MYKCSERRWRAGGLAATLALAFAVTAHGQARAARPAAAAPQQPFGFGKPATTQEIAGWDIDVRPDGAGLPKGSGSVAQGQDLYDAKCASCHGTFGESTDYLPLAGGVGSLATPQPVRTTGSKLNHATTLFDYIRRAMPFTAPQTLKTDEVYALTAYVLNLNDIVPADATIDQDSLPKLSMPNRDGFTTDHGLARRDGKPDTHNVACMTNCATQVRLSSEMPDYARDSHGNLAEQTRGLGAVEGIKLGPPPARVAAVSVATAKESTATLLAQRAGCMVCHGVDNRIVGPGFREVSAKYAGDAGTEGRLLAKVRTGGAGVWGQVAMLPQPQIRDADAKAIIQWILGGAK